MTCVHCDRPLLCKACEVEYEPRTQEQYEAISRIEVPVICTDCEEILVCYWCKTAYDGQVDD